MNRAEAQAIVQAVIDPLPLDQFLGALGKSVLSVPGGAQHARAALFGPDPAATVLAGHSTHAGNLDCHAVTPQGDAPAPKPCASPEEFRALIGAYHARDYSVRVPDVVPLAPSLARFARALELVLGAPVDASLFWSRREARAKVHYDDNDVIAIQLAGRKRWYTSTEPPLLHNKWEKSVMAVLPPERQQVTEMAPGDLLYVPRGTTHSVDSLEESLHLSILVTPLTMRAAIGATLDHLSDLDRSLRETPGDLPAANHGEAPADLRTRIGAAVERLLAQVRSPGFVDAAMQRHFSRFVGELPQLPIEPPAAPIGPGTLMEHMPTAIGHLIAFPQRLDFAQPGGHIALHPGAEPAMRFVIETPRFRVGDIPGLADEVRVALVERLVSSGFLRVAAS